MSDNCDHTYDEDGICSSCGECYTQEIERLRGENEDLKSRLAEWVNLGNQYLFGNAVDNMVKADKTAVFTDEMLHIITTKQIRAAWDWLNDTWRTDPAREILEYLLKFFGIVRCEGDGCDNGMMLIAKNTPQCGVQECPDCKGEGWVIKDA